MSKIMLLAVLISLTGCLHACHSGLVTPAHCVRVSVQSFTQPCTGPDGKFVCNGVVITASCLAPPPIPASSVGEEAKAWPWQAESGGVHSPGCTRQTDRFRRRVLWPCSWPWRQGDGCWAHSCMYGNHSAARDSPHTCGPGEPCNGSPACPRGKCRNRHGPVASSSWVLPKSPGFQREVGWREL